MIVITGATGQLNGATTDHLLASVPASEIVVVARDPAKAARFADRGVTVRHGDYADPDSLPAAFAGADQLLLVSSSDPHTDAVPLHAAAINAAVDVGVGRILYTSHQGASPETPFGPGRDHVATEELLVATGLPWTALRNGFYANSLAWLLGSWQETGVVTVPGDGPVSWTAREDAAEAAAVIIESLHGSGDAAVGTYDGPVTLTAGAAPTFADVAEIASSLTGRRVTTTVLDPDEWIARRVAAGTPEFAARFTLGMYQAAEEGFFAGVDPVLGELLGREPRTVRDALAEQIS